MAHSLFSSTDTYFHVDESGVVSPLGATLLRDSKSELIPESKDISDTIPGLHGEFSHGSRFEPREFEMHMAIKCQDKGATKRHLAKALQPAMFEYQPLVFASDPGKAYYVKYTGTMRTIDHVDGLEITVPFTGEPFAIGAENTHVGSGVLHNDGDWETPVVIEVRGDSPAITVGGETLKYIGALSSADTLIIDTGKMTVTFNGVNALASYEGGFPLLEPGEVEVAAPDNVTFRWRSRWLS